MVLYKGGLSEAEQKNLQPRKGRKTAKRILVYGTAAATLFTAGFTAGAIEGHRDFRDVKSLIRAIYEPGVNVMFKVPKLDIVEYEIGRPEKCNVNGEERIVIPTSPYDISTVIAQNPKMEKELGKCYGDVEGTGIHDLAGSLPGNNKYKSEWNKRFWTKGKKFRHYRCD